MSFYFVSFFLLGCPTLLPVDDTTILSTLPVDDAILFALPVDDAIILFTLPADDDDTMLFTLPADDDDIACAPAEDDDILCAPAVDDDTVFSTHDCVDARVLLMVHMIEVPTKWYPVLQDCSIQLEEAAMVLLQLLLKE
jgi:hypothetical protein